MAIKFEGGGALVEELIFATTNLSNWEKINGIIKGYNVLRGLEYQTL